MRVSPVAIVENDGAKGKSTANRLCHFGKYSLRTVDCLLKCKSKSPMRRREAFIATIVDSNWKVKAVKLRPCKDFFATNDHPNK